MTGSFFGLLVKKEQNSGERLIVRNVSNFKSK